MLRLRGERRRDEGETLVELIVAIAILGIAGVAVLAGMMLNVRASSLNRSQAGGGAYVRSAAEAIQKSVDASGGFATCANAVVNSGAGTYWSAANALFSPTDVSNGYSVKILQVQSWQGAGTGWGSCNTTGTQRIQIQVTTLGTLAGPAVETLYVALRKPCAKAGTGAGGALVTGDDPCA
jgi:type II secretory pathway pseudopilin PulG